MIKGGRATVVVVVVVTTVCWVAGPKDMEATVEFGGGMVETLSVEDLFAGWEVDCLLSGISSVGDAGAVDRMASEARAPEGLV